MMIREDNIRQQVKTCLDKINAKRAAKLKISNDVRAAAMGFFIDSQGVLRRQRNQRVEGKALITSWPIINVNVR